MTYARRKAFYSCYWILATGATILGLPLAFGATVPFDLEGVKFEMQIPDGWRSEPNFMGTPLMVLGPQKFDTRPVIIVVPTTVEPRKVDIKSLQKTQREYFKGRDAWMSLRGASSVAEFPYQHARVNENLDLHSIGHRYEHDGQVFDQHTHYAICGGKFFYISTLINETLHADFSDSMKEVLQSLRCP